MTDPRNTDLFLFIAFFILTSLGVTLMMFLPHHNATMGFIHDTSANTGGVLTISSLFIWFKDYRTIKPRIWGILSVGLGLAAYEFIQIFLPWATFDFHDILGTLIGTVIAIGINLMVVSIFFKKG